MCGIAGYAWTDREADENLVERMNQLIRHRGPDQGGRRVFGGCGLGMRRLSIIDLATGEQPIGNEDGSVWTVFNGEIYNFQSLRQELEAEGHRFRTRSDTETIVHLYEQSGIDGLSRLRGMFAIAVWDARRRRILLARDRFGKKPLYYSVLDDGHAAPKGLYFGSELKCLRAAGVPLDIDEEALKLYFSFGWIPDPYSPFQAIRKLPPGSWLTMDADGAVNQGRYWEFPLPASDPPPGLTPEVAQQQLLSHFDEAVKLRLISDVPLGAFLSGGIDSSAVVASMALQTDAPVKTFSIGFEEAAYNELPYARAVADKYQTEHHEIVVRPDSVALAQRIVGHFDEPFADSSAIPTLIVSEFAAEHVKVCLSGDGGDELFGGYPRYRQAQHHQRWDLLPLAVRAGLGKIADALPYSAYGKNFLHGVSRTDPVSRYFSFNTMPHYLRQRILGSRWIAPLDAAYLDQHLWRSMLSADAGIAERIMHFETTVGLPADMLVKVDRMSMAASLEVRCPLLDHHIGEFAASIPTAWKIDGAVGKKILVDAVSSRLPDSILNRPKQGFGIPLSLWFRTSLRDLLQDTLGSRRFLDRGLVSEPFVRALMVEHHSGRRDNSTWLWTLLMLALWFDWLDPPLAAAPQP